MKLSFKNWRQSHPRRKYSGDEQPLRSDLFSADQMNEHGKALAASHELSIEPAGNPLLARLAENEDVLIGIYTLLTEAVAAGRRIAPAGEWLLDNFYLIEEQIHMAKRHLPKGYSRGLPRLMNGASAGLPRVYDIAREAISHGDGRLDIEGLGSFVASYQTVTSLTLGELWAIPTMLRLALIENLRRIGAGMATGTIDRNGADHWADRITDIAERDPKSLIMAIADMTRSSPNLSSSFVAEFSRRLQGLGSALALPLTWIEQRLSESGLTIKSWCRRKTNNRRQTKFPSAIASVVFDFLDRPTGGRSWSRLALSKRSCAKIRGKHTAKWIFRHAIGTVMLSSGLRNVFTSPNQPSHAVPSISPRVRPQKANPAIESYTLVSTSSTKGCLSLNGQSVLDARRPSRCGERSESSL